MEAIHHVESLKFTDDSLVVKVDGKQHQFLLVEISPKLAQASETERNHYRIMASGYGIHWPLLDEDLSIDGLLGITHKPVLRSRDASQNLQIA